MNGAEYLLDPNLLKLVTSEHVLHAVNQVLHLVSESEVSIQVSIKTLAKLIVDADGIFDDDSAIEIALQKKKVDSLHYDGEKMLDNFMSLAIQKDEKNDDAIEQKINSASPLKASNTPMEEKNKTERKTGSDKTKKI